MFLKKKSVEKFTKQYNVLERERITITNGALDDDLMKHNCKKKKKNERIFTTCQLNFLFFIFKRFFKICYALNHKDITTLK